MEVRFRIRYNPKITLEYSKGGGTEGHAYIAPVWRHLNDRNVPILWNDSNGRNLNLNWFENDWNSNYRFLAVRNFLQKPPPCGGLSV